MERADRLDAFLEERDLDAVWFARPASFAWLTGGDNVITASAPVGVAAAGYDGSVRVVTDTIEAERLREEELPPDVPVESYPWHATSLAEAVAAASPEPAAADFPVPGMGEVDPSRLRQPLAESDVSAYRRLGEAAARAVEAACAEATPTDTERDVAGAVRRRLEASGIRSPVLLVGGEERALRYRHFTPTDAALGGYALVSVTAERGGLHASLTRTVAFDPPDWLRERREAAARVETAALLATREVGRRGGTAAEVFAEVQAAYEAVGHPGEWRRHHQGGAAGFAGREWIATPESDADVVLPMAYAWNPTIAGAKSENTWLVTTEGVEALTPGDWGTKSVDDARGGERLEHPTSTLHRPDRA